MKLLYIACWVIQMCLVSPGAAEQAVPIEGHIFSRVGNDANDLLTCRPADGAEMERVASSRSAVECSRSCLGAEDCQAVAFTRQEGGLCLLYNQVWNSGQCAVMGDWEVLVKGEVNSTECLNGGNPKTDGSGCQCYDGYVGDKCEKLMEDCQEGKDSGHYADFNLQYFKVQPRLMKHSVTVLCLNSGYTVFQKRITPTYNFNRTWQEYVDGFGMGSHDFWIGLKNLYWFTNSKPYNFGVYMYLKNSTRLTFFYKDFLVKENLTYTATLGRFLSGDLPGHLDDKMNDRAFSTFDNDHDNNATANCGLLYGGGWWFDDCVGEVNFNGRLVKDGVLTAQDQVHYPWMYGDLVPKSVSLRLANP